jgi:starch phosphorylase
MPRFNSSRMVGEYVAKSYLPAARQGRRYAENQFEAARSVAAWKARARAAWPGVTIRRLNTPKKRIHFGDAVYIETAVKLNGLGPEDVVVELLVNRDGASGKVEPVQHRFVSQGVDATGEHRFSLNLVPELCGKMEYRVRMYPRHELLTHPFELGLMIWV